MAKYRLPRIQAKLERTDPALDNFPFVDEPPTGSQPYAVYNPRRMRWERPDGTPIESSRNSPPRKEYRISVKDDKGNWQAFPFGVYERVPFEHVPTEYLKWFLEEGEDRGNGLYPAVQAVYEARAD
jgi:hypothetical protein